MKIKAKNIIHDRLYDDNAYTSLTAGKVYDVIEIDGIYFRMIDDHGEPILCERDAFDIIDDSIPEDWISQDEDNGAFHMVPMELSDQYLFEAYFDGDDEAAKVLEQYARSHGLPVLKPQNKARLH